MATDTVVLKCLGQAPVRELFLDGRTGDGSVALAPSTFSPFSGTHWRRRTDGDVWILQCLGEAPGARFLDGRTADGTVGLAPSTNPPFTGTRWRARSVAGGVTLECLGDIPGPRRFLDGRTGDATVAMAPSTDPPFTGTHWLVTAPPQMIDPGSEGHPADG